jgi:cytoskeletal protein RodZ
MERIAMQSRNHQSERELTERLAVVGRHLQAVRQEQGLSLDNVAVKTLIPKRILIALEAGDLKQLPEPVYIQGFVRRYAEAVGMPPTELAIAPVLNTTDKAARHGRRFFVSPQLRPLHLYLIYTAVVFVAVSGLSKLLTQPTYQQKLGIAIAPASTLDPVMPSASADKVFKPNSASMAELPSEPKSGKPIRLGVTLVSQSWLRVVVDGKTDFEGVLSEGTERLWEADRQITLRAGNAGGVVVNLNNGLSKPLGAPGSVEEVTFGASSDSAKLANSDEG